MKSSTYLNIILTVIALNLSILSLVLLGWVPGVQADAPAPKESYVGTVRLAPNEVLDVNIEQLDGRSFYGELPVIIEESEERLNVNIEQVGGQTVYSGRLKVEHE